MTTAPDRATAKKALGIARETALTLAKGPAATGFVVTKKGVSTLRARRAHQRSLAPAPAAPSSARRPRRALVLVSVVVLLAAGAAALSRRSRNELPPPAAEPPRLDTPTV